jgi:hypothetical protein
MDEKTPINEREKEEKMTTPYRCTLIPRMLMMNKIFGNEKIHFVDERFVSLKRERSCRL